ncbi:MAG TPA: DinB family protein [Spirochaetota bacterium]
MKKYLTLLAQYNQKAHNAALAIAAALSAEERMADRGSFMKNIHGVFDHIAEGQLYFQRQIFAAFPSAATRHQYIDRKTTYGGINFPSFEELADVIEVTDAAYLSLIAGLSDAELEKIIPVESFEGDKRQSSAFILLQGFNHATHHRGQLSQIFDEMKLENDYSGIADA